MRERDRECLCGIQVQFLRFSFFFLHDCKTSPLHANLHDAQQAREAREPVDLTTTGHIRPAAGEGENVGKLACSRGGAQQDEVGRQAKGGFAIDDADVLREVRHQDTQQDQDAEGEVDVARLRELDTTILRKRRKERRKFGDGEHAVVLCCAGCKRDGDVGW